MSENLYSKLLEVLYFVFCAFSISYLASLLVKVVYILRNYTKNSSEMRLQHTMEAIMGIQSQILNQRLIIAVIDTSNEVDTAVRQLYRKTTYFPVLGMDAEFKRRYAANSDGSSRTINGRPTPEVHLMQWATKCGLCYLMRIRKIVGNTKVLPYSLTGLLSDNNIWKTGVAAYNDVNYLLHDFPGQFVIKGTFDLRYLAYAFDISERGLKNMAKKLLFIEYDYENMESGNWDSESLSPAQIKYAAWDAMLGVLLFDKFYQLYKQKVQEEEPAKSDAEIWSSFVSTWEKKKSKQFTDDFTKFIIAKFSISTLIEQLYYFEDWCLSR